MLGFLVPELVLDVVVFGILALIGYTIYRVKFLEKLMLDAKGRVIVVTGCDSGFGRELALRLVARGCTVIAGCLTLKGADELHRNSGDNDKSLITAQVDVADTSSVENFVRTIRDTLKEENKELHALVNNAGIFAAGPAEWTRLDVFKRLFDVNVLGAIDMTTRLLPLLDEGKGGRLITMSSISGVVHTPFLSAYSASKAAIDSFHSCLRVESLRNVSTHLIMPGGFKTPLLNPENLKKSLQKAWDSTNERVRSDFGEKFFNQFSESWTRGVSTYASTNTGWVVDCVEHALFSQHPRLRYYAGYDAIFFFAWLSSMPTVIQDLLSARLRKRSLKGDGGYTCDMASRGKQKVHRH